MSKLMSQQVEITIQPEQMKVLQLPFDGAVLIKGVAGSGKTTIALHRAKYLLDNYGSINPKSIIVFTFNRLLANYLENIKRTVTTNYCKKGKSKHDSLNDINVVNFHQWAYYFMQSYGISMCKNTVNGYQKEDKLSFIISKNLHWDIKNKPLSFLADEISWIKGKLLQTLDEYQSISRVGRGTNERLSKEQRAEIWELLELYNAQLDNECRIDFDDYARVCLDIIDSQEDFEPPYMHIIVDEAQDLNKAQLTVIKRLVSNSNGSISIIADSAQKIYKSGFTWAEVGWEFKGGRTCVLKRNYRSTIEIARASLSLLNSDTQKEEFTQIDSARKGTVLPVVYKATTYDEQINYIKSLLPNLLNTHNSVVLLVKNKTEIDILKATLDYDDFECRVLSKYNPLPESSSKLYLCTYTTVKGLEFDVVLILNCNNDSFPYHSEIGEDDEEQRSMQRRRIFTAMTRARECLYLVSSDIDYAKYLDEIDMDFIDTAN